MKTFALQHDWRRIDAMSSFSVRPGTWADREILEAMLYEAFFWSPSAQRPDPGEFMQDPEFSKLLEALCDAADRAGIAGVSSSVAPENFARSLYGSVGFREVGGSGTSVTMLLEFDARP